MVHRPERSPSQRFRFEQFLPDLAAAGIGYEYSHLVSAADDRQLYQPGNWLAKANILRRALSKRWRELATLEAYSTIFVQREALMLGTTYFERQYAKSAARFVFDFDDAIWLHNAQNVSAANRALSFLKNPNKIAQLCALADTVVVGNQYLADYARQFSEDVRIIPTTLDTDRYMPQAVMNPKTGPVVIGWSGSMTTVPHFHSLSPVLEKLKARYGKRIAFRVYGDQHYRNVALGVQGEPWNAASEIPTVSAFDVGIMPLPDDEWTRGKCGFKGLLYMSLGVPTVMARVGVNPEIVAHGQNGLLAQTPSEWFEALTTLIEDAELRRKLGTAGRQTVVARYSRKAWRNAYLELLRA